MYVNDVGSVSRAELHYLTPGFQVSISDICKIDNEDCLNNTKTNIKTRTDTLHDVPCTCFPGARDNGRNSCPYNSNQSHGWRS